MRAAFVPFETGGFQVNKKEIAVDDGIARSYGTAASQNVKKSCKMDRL